MIFWFLGPVVLIGGLWLGWWLSKHEDDQEWKVVEDEPDPDDEEG